MAASVLALRDLLHPPAVEGLGKIWIQIDRLTEVSDSLLTPVERSLHTPTNCINFRIVGFQEDNLVKIYDGILVLAKIGLEKTSIQGTLTHNPA